MEKKELIVKTKYEELYKTEDGYWIEHIEYEDEAETVRFEGGGCSISNEVVDKLLDKAREEGYKKGREDQQHLDGLLYGTTVATTTTLEEGWILKDKKKVEEELSKLTTK